MFYETDAGGVKRFQTPAHLGLGPVGHGLVKQQNARTRGDGARYHEALARRLS
jgi:hypothetical protein